MADTCRQTGTSLMLLCRNLTGLISSWSQISTSSSWNDVTCGVDGILAGKWLCVIFSVSRLWRGTALRWFSDKMRVTVSCLGQNTTSRVRTAPFSPSSFSASRCWWLFTWLTSLVQELSEWCNAASLFKVHFHIQALSELTLVCKCWCVTESKVLYCDKVIFLLKLGHLCYCTVLWLNIELVLISHFRGSTALDPRFFSHMIVNIV